MPKNKPRNSKSSPSKKVSKRGEEIREGTKKLFEDLGALASQDPPADHPRKKESKKGTKSERESAVLKKELDALHARIKELETLEAGQPQLKSPTIYEKEQIGYAYKENTLQTLDPSQPEEKVEEKNIIQAPLISTGKHIGKMLIEAAPEQDWDPEDTNLLNTIAERASLQIQSLRLLSSAERARTEAEEATRRFIHKNWENYLDAIHQNKKIGYAYDQASVIPFLDEADPDTYQATVKVMEEQIGRLAVKHAAEASLSDNDKKMISSIASQVAQQVENLRLLADAARAREEAEEATRRLVHEGWESFAARNKEEQSLGFTYDTIKVAPKQDTTLPENVTFAVPLEASGAEIGHLAVAGQEEISQEALNLAAEIAARASTHIESLRLLEETEYGRQQLDKRAAELETVAKVSTAAAAIRDPESLLRSVVDLTNYSFKLYHTSVYLLEETEEGKQKLNLVAASGKTGHEMLQAGHTLDFDQQNPLFAKIARAQNVHIISDVLEDTAFLGHDLLPETRSEMIVPMIVADKFIGIFDVKSENPDRFSEEDISTYTTLASQTSVALQNAQLYEEQLATVERLRELDRLKSSFLANMSHELRTPLNSISGFTQVMLEGLDGELTSEMEDDLQLIDKNANHLLNLINEVLDMAKIEAGKLSVTIAPANLHRVIEDVVQTTAPLARENDLSISLENNLPEDLIVMADEMRIQQVMINLIGNAMKFTEEGGISIRSEMADDLIRIQVQDTGMGIPPEELENIFEAFSQVDTSTTRKTGGTGLGLPISRRFIEMHNGRLWAESEEIPGKGSLFTIELPVILPEKSEE